MLPETEDSAEYRAVDDGPVVSPSLSSSPTSSSLSSCFQRHRKPIVALSIILAAAVALGLLAFAVNSDSDSGNSGSGGGGDGPSPPPPPPPDPTSGRNITLAGMDVYQVGQGDRILLYLPDIYGWRQPAIDTATDYSAAGYLVYLLDYFDGRSGVAGGWTVDNSTLRARAAVEALRAQYPLSPIFATGYCWGGGVGVRLTYNDSAVGSGHNSVDGAVVSHASSVTAAVFNRTRSPLFAVMPQNDPGFNNQVGAFLSSLTCAGCTGRSAQFKVYPGVSHGFAVTVNVSDDNAVLQKQTAFYDSVMFLDAISP